MLHQVFDAAADAGRPVTFTLIVGNAGDPTREDALTMVERANGSGAAITAQVLPRPIVVYLAQAWDWIFPLGGDADYEPDPSNSIAARAKARGVSPAEEAYDRLPDDDGHAILLDALANFRDGSPDTIGTLIRRDDVVLGLGDGGAHYGMICDSSLPTYLLAHRARDRRPGGLASPRPFAN